MSATIVAIAAMSENRVIGRDNDLPWHVPEDLNRFFELTKGHVVVMGRKTYDSLSEKWKPLPERTNVVISRNKDLELAPEVELRTDPIAAVSELQKTTSGTIWIIGGGEIYRQTLPLVERIELTLIAGNFEGDVTFPVFEEQFELENSEAHDGFSYNTYVRRAV